MGIFESKVPPAAPTKTMKELAKEFSKNIRKLQREFQRETSKLQMNNKNITRQIEQMIKKKESRVFC